MSDKIVSLSDRVKELSHSTGTGNLRLDGAATGFSAFGSAYSYDDALYYAVTDLTNYEVGSGQYIQDGGNNALRRFPITSSNGNAIVNFGAGVKEVYVTYPGKSAVFTASGIGDFQAPQVSGVPFWGSSQILSYDPNIVWGADSDALGITQPNPQYAIDVGGLSSYSLIRASGFIAGDSGVYVSVASYSGGRQLEPFMRNEVDTFTGTDAVIALSGLVDQRLLFRQQGAGLVFAGPPSGCTPPLTCSPDYPSFRALTSDDIPDLSDLYLRRLTSAGAAGEVTFYDVSGIITSDPYFTWNNTFNRLGVNQSSPSYELDVSGNIRSTDNLIVGGYATVTGDINATQIVFSDSSIISGAYQAGSGLELHNGLEFNIGNVLKFSDAYGTSGWIHQGDTVLASGASGIFTRYNPDSNILHIGYSGIVGTGSMSNWVANDGIGGSGAINDSNVFTVSGVSGVTTQYSSTSNIMFIGVDASGHTFKKNNVVTASTGNVILVGEQTINGVALASGDRVLLPFQSTASENGLWVVGADPYGSWTRPIDFPSSGEASASWTHQQFGTHYDESVWFCVNDNPCAIDYDDQEWRFFDGGASVSGWADSRDAAISGWADATISNRDTAISGWTDATMSTRDAAISGWADSTMSSRDTAISGWADAMSSNKDAAISGWAEYTITDEANTAGTGLQLVGSVFNTAGTGSFSELRFAGNIRVGDYAGDIGTENIFIGKYAGIDVHISSDRNAAIGYSAGSGMLGDNIVAIGYRAGVDGTLGGASTVIGYEAGMNARYLNFGTALGEFAVKDSINCYGVVAIGQATFQNSDDIQFVEAIGWQAGKSTHSTTGVSVLGSYAGYNCSGNYYSSFIGYKAAQSVLNSYELSTLGYYASSYSSVSSGCVAIGSFAGSHSHDMQYSNSIGYLAGSGSEVTEGSNFIGHLAGTDVSQDTRSTFIGTEAGATSSGNEDFIAIGFRAGGNSSGPSYDHVRIVAIGFRAGESSTNGLNTTYIGTSAGASSHHNYRSDMIGASAGYSSHSSSGCIMIGQSAGQASSGCSHSIYMGMFAGWLASGNNQLVIDVGYNAVGTGTWSYANKNDNNILSIGQTITGNSSDKYLRIGATGTLADYSNSTLSIKSNTPSRTTLKLEPATSQTANQLVAVSGVVTDNPIINAAGLLRIPTFPTIVAATGSIGAASSANSGVIVLAGTALIVSDGSSWITV